MKSVSVRIGSRWIGPSLIERTLGKSTQRNGISDISIRWIRSNESSKCCILAWKSCKVKRVVTSTYDAETISLEFGLKEEIVIKDQIVKMTGFDTNLINIEAFVDCKDTYEAIISNKKFTKGSRLASLEVAKIKEMLEMKQIKRIS